MPSIHKQMSEGRWAGLSLAEQMGNIGSEVVRARSAGERGDIERRNNSLDRALELADLTARLCASPARQRELSLLRRELAAMQAEIDSVNIKNLEQYFLPFALLARKGING